MRLRSSGPGLEEIVRRFREGLPVRREWNMDGLRLEVPSGILLVRQSVTELAITLRMEGLTGEDLESLAGRVRALLPEYDSELEDQLSGARQR
ncbi:MAG: hypothetical protein GY953_48615 [bacterium]|nr:hypothetical protein [bacterium]